MICRIFWFGIFAILLLLCFLLSAVVSFNTISKQMSGTFSLPFSSNDNTVAGKYIFSAIFCVYTAHYLFGCNGDGILSIFILLYWFEYGIHFIYYPNVNRQRTVASCGWASRPNALQQDVLSRSGPNSLIKQKQKKNKKSSDQFVSIIPFPLSYSRFVVVVVLSGNSSLNSTFSI